MVLCKLISVADVSLSAGQRSWLLSVLTEKFQWNPIWSKYLSMYSTRWIALRFIFWRHFLEICEDDIIQVQTRVVGRCDNAAPFSQSKVATCESPHRWDRKTVERSRTGHTGALARSHCNDHRLHEKNTTELNDFVMHILIKHCKIMTAKSDMGVHQL